jgi:hypothetical protein
MTTNQITLPVSGVTLTVRRQPMDVMLMLQSRARALHEAPAIPQVTEEIGPNQTITRDDTSNPDYIRALAEYEQKWTTSFGEMLITVLARTCIVKDATFEKHIADARDVQQTYKDLGVEVPEDINEFAIKFIIAVSAEDINYLMMEAFGKSMPSEGQVAMRAAMFQS